MDGSQNALISQTTSSGLTLIAEWENGLYPSWSFRFVLIQSLKLAVYDLGSMMQEEMDRLFLLASWTG